MTPVGFPHSDISGSKRACRSPKLIAACCVLHRLSAPRHPPSTLSNLTIKCLELIRICFSVARAFVLPSSPDRPHRVLVGGLGQDARCLPIYASLLPYSIFNELPSDREDQP